MMCSFDVLTRPGEDRGARADPRAAESPRGQLSTSKDKRHAGACTSVGARSHWRDSAHDSEKPDATQRRCRGQQALRQQPDRREDRNRQRPGAHRHVARRVVMLRQCGMSVEPDDAKDDDAPEQRGGPAMMG